jgi:energy-coupling factor transporter ATP-binding protein EcfA2
MYFQLLPHGVSVPPNARSKAFLLTDNWDDWFEFSTLYTLVVFDATGERHVVGGVKIGEFDMKAEQRRASIPSKFPKLGDQFFSLGQDDSYYEALNDLGADIRDRILRGLHDVALEQERFDRALKEKVTRISLLRSVTPATVRGQFYRLARGGARLSRYEFDYRAPKRPRSRAEPVTLSFVVEPESEPPSNIHVLIGRNGVGKTHLLHHMTRAVVEEDSNAAEVGAFTVEGEVLDDFLFSNLVSVTFSAFDPFEPLPIRRDKSKGVQYAYIGLKRVGSKSDGTPHPPKSPESLSKEFAASVLICRQGARATRWRRALEMLETDPIFLDAELVGLATDELERDDEEIKTQAREVFGKLSSGHKIVLLTMTRLVETVAERTLVLLDEPEAHLHPPLLSAFVRALSDLVVDRNGVAIIATHSPVVLQEVPKSCVWKVRRSGAKLVAERPEIETFGENVGILTREAFGLEVTQAGFHRMLRDAVSDGDDYEEILERFGGELGGEAKALVRALIGVRADGEL